VNDLSFSRRQLLGATVATGFLTGTARASTLAEVVAGLKDPPLPGTKLPTDSVPLPTAPVMSAYRVPATVRMDQPIDPRLLARARAAYDRHRSRIDRTGIVAITDFSMASRDPRFFLMDTASGRVTRHLVAHGRGSDPGHRGWLERFSNAIGSNASSAGAYVTGDFYHGKYGRSMRLSGLETRNSNAHARALVIHSAWYAEPDQIAQYGKLGRSEGCFALSGMSHREAMFRLGPGAFLYADKLA